MVLIMTILFLLGMAMIALLAYSVGFGGLPFLVRLPLTGLFAFALGYLVLELINEVVMMIRAQKID